MTKNPLTHKIGAHTGYLVAAYEFSLNATYSVLIGYLSGKIFKWYPAETGAVMGGCVATLHFIPSRIASNEVPRVTTANVARMEAWAAGRPPPENFPHTAQLLTFVLPQLSWLAPLAANLFKYKITIGITLRYWAASIGTRLICWPAKALINSSLSHTIGSSMRYNHGPTEYLSRPRANMQTKISDEGLQVVPQLPEIYEVDQLDANGTPTIVELFEQVGEPQFSADAISAIRGKAVSANSIDKNTSMETRQYYQLQRNLAYHVSQLDPERQASILRDIELAFEHCQTNRVPVFYNILLGCGQNDATPVGRVRARILQHLQEVKRQILEEFARSVDIEIEAHSWARLVGALHEPLGLFKGDVDAEQTFRQAAKDQAAEELRQKGLSEAEIAQQLKIYDGIFNLFDWFQHDFEGEQDFWITAFKARYTPDLIVPGVQAVINSDQELRNLAQQIVIEQLIDRLDDEGLEDADPFGLAGELYVEQIGQNTAGVPINGLNEEGTVLLLKITGELLDDGRLHTQKPDAAIMQRAREMD